MKVTQVMLDRAIQRLVESSKIEIETNDCYGYSQLMTKSGHAIDSTEGDSKKDLYFQIMFYLDIKSAQRRENKGEFEN